MPVFSFAHVQTSAGAPVGIDLGIRHDPGTVTIAPCLVGAIHRPVRVLLEVSRQGQLGQANTRQLQTFLPDDSTRHCHARVRQSLTKGDRIHVRLEVHEDGQAVIVRETTLGDFPSEPPR